ncbi:MAG: hypothetical protein E7505_11120 [Ruminococcus sp.]|nr:hypothetical protein [Ruminococcus sp.]
MKKRIILVGLALISSMMFENVSATVEEVSDGVLSSSKNVDDSDERSENDSGYTSNYEYYYYCKNDVPLTHTYNKRINLSAGQTYIFTTEKSDDFPDCDTELFLFKNETSPGVNSWYNDDAQGAGRYSRIEATITSSGNYILMCKVYSRTERTGACPDGHCNVYSINPGTNQKTLLQRNAELGGYLLSIPNYNLFTSRVVSEFNSFTANSVGSQLPDYVDPMMFVFSGNASAKKTIGFDDDYIPYDASSLYDWGTDCRVRQPYGDSNGIPSSVFIAAYTPDYEGTCDLYAMCGNIYPLDPTLPKLKYDDSIISGERNGEPLDPNVDDSSNIYCNCIAYAGGITSASVSTGMVSPWYSPDGMEQSFDNYFGNWSSENQTYCPRYVGAVTYEVTNNADDAVVNVYARRTTSEYLDWSHASVRKPANNHFHGYSWESKMGTSYRIFHAEDSLESRNLDDEYNRKGFGTVVRRYKIAQNSRSDISGLSNISMEQSIKQGHTKLLEVDFSDKEIKRVNSCLDSVSSDVIKKFDLLYNNWVYRIYNDINYAVESNSYYYTLAEEYKELSDFIDKNEKLLYHIMKKKMTEEYDPLLDVLIEYKIVEKNDETKLIVSKVRKANNEISIKSLDSKVYIAPSCDANIKSFIKEILAMDKEIF